MQEFERLKVTHVNVSLL